MSILYFAGMDLSKAEDLQLFNWFCEAINNAPSLKALDGIRHTAEWMYDIDNDFEMFEAVLKQIENKQTHPL